VISVRLAAKDRRIGSGLLEPACDDTVRPVLVAPRRHGVTWFNEEARTARLHTALAAV